MLKPLLIITAILFFIGAGLYYFHESSNFNKSPKLAQSNQKLLKDLNTKSLDRIKIFGNALGLIWFNCREVVGKSSL